jgi:hypothetical protein
MKPITSYFSTVYTNWRQTLSDGRIQTQVIITLALYAFLFKYCRLIMTELETRKGTQILDPLLSIIPAHDVSLITFSFTYITLSLFIIATIIKPKTFIIAMQAYCFLIIMRTISIYLVPLEPPVGLILLKDPVSFIFMSTPSGGYIVKDLFFSGHVSTAMLFVIICPHQHIKKMLLLFTVLIGTFILIQHVHYTIDVVAAPFFSFLAYKCSLLVDNAIHKTPETVSSNIRQKL